MIQFYTRLEDHFKNYFFIIPDKHIIERNEDYVLFQGEGMRFYHDGGKFYMAGKRSSGKIKYYPIENVEDNQALKQMMIKHGCWPYDWVLRNYPRGE